MLPGAHKPTTRQDIFFYLRKVDLDHHALLPSVFVPDLGHSISRATNFQEDFALNVSLRGRNHQLRVFGIAGGATSKVGLMLLSLGVSQVGAFVGMQCQAQSTFERPQMISENVRILKVGSYQIILEEDERIRTFARSIVSSASFLRRSRLSTLLSDAPATPPPPNLEPTRFYDISLNPAEKLMDGMNEKTNLIIWRKAIDRQIYIIKSRDGKTHPF